MSLYLYLSLLLIASEINERVLFLYSKSKNSVLYKFSNNLNFSFLPISKIVFSSIIYELSLFIINFLKLFLFFVIALYLLKMKIGINILFSPDSTKNLFFLKKFSSKNLAISSNNSVPFLFKNPIIKFINFKGLVDLIFSRKAIKFIIFLSNTLFHNISTSLLSSFLSILLAFITSFIKSSIIPKSFTLKSSGRRSIKLSSKLKCFFLFSVFNMRNISIFFSVINNSYILLFLYP